MASRGGVEAARYLKVLILRYGLPFGSAQQLREGCDQRAVQLVFRNAVRQFPVQGQQGQGDGKDGIGEKHHPLQ